MNISAQHDNAPFAVHYTQHAGRCLKATRLISKGAPILKTGPPILSVVMREYRREVCAHCFRYDRGRNLSVRRTPTGKSFCNEECQVSWEQEMNLSLPDGVGDIVGLGVKSWEAVEEFVKRKSGARGAQDVAMHDAGVLRPSAAGADAAWVEVEELGECVREARLAQANGVALSKKQRKALQEALDSKSRICDADVLSLLLAGVLLRARSPSPPSSALQNGTPTSLPTSTSLSALTEDTVPPNRSSLSSQSSPSSAWPSLLALASTPNPYITHHGLASHTSAYLILLALLPLPLLPYTTASTLRAIPAYEVHNSFGIRSLDDVGSEFLGYGVWAEASLFNHSCAPNVGKARATPPARGPPCAAARTPGGDGGDGRTWTFWATSDVAGGEELCISYLGGEEDALSVRERKKRLWDVWHFDCSCRKCVDDMRAVEQLERDAGSRVC